MILIINLIVVELIILVYRGIMNTILLVISTIIIVTTHLFAITVFTKEDKPLQVSKPQYHKISMQFAQVIPKPKQITKSEQKKVIKKEIFKKPVKKDAKRELVKKTKPIPKKKIQKKKNIKKVVKKKTVEKKIIKAPIKKVKKTAPKDTTQSLKKYKQIKQNYITQLRVQVDKNKKYPRVSRKLKEQGKVTIIFRVLNNGKFTNIKILKKSSKRRLNKAALDAVLLTKRFKKFPKELSNKQFIDIALPINFKLH